MESGRRDYKKPIRRNITMINKNMTIEQILRVDVGTADILQESGMLALAA